ncbi:MAG: hypothetical protein F6J87_22710 [Spirulina sp. SIO3F2]|nr:hypothetical protein [Spirulina sp. SIO3F2]
MAELVEFELSNGQTILAEVEEPDLDDSAIEPIARDPEKPWKRARQSLKASLDNLQPMLADLKEKLDDLNQEADEVEVKFGVKLTGQCGAVLTSVGGEVTYEVTLKWNK